MKRHLNRPVSKPYELLCCSLSSWPSITPRLLLPLWPRRFQDPGAEDRWRRRRATLVAPPMRPPRPVWFGVLFPLQTFNPAKRPVMAPPLLPLPPHLLGLCGHEKRALHKRGGQCCETPAMHLPPRDSDLRTWVGPSNTAREGLQSQGRRPVGSPCEMGQQGDGA